MQLVHGLPIPTHTPPLHRGGRSSTLMQSRYRQRLAPHTPAASSSQNEDNDLQRTRQQLNALFFQAETPIIPDAASAMLLSLPLWRVQWSVLPGCTQTLNVHVPHYAHMFTQLVRGPRPWRFGHVYLPGGSTNLGNEAYALRPGTGAPLVGTLMEIQRLVQLADGRLIVIARGVARLRVVAETQALPFARADCELLPDMEEVARWNDAALAAAADAVADPDTGDAAAAVAVGRVAHDIQAAAAAAAAASLRVWCCWEVAREDLGLGAPRAVACQAPSDEAAAVAALRHLEAGVPFPEVSSSESDVVLHATRSAADHAASLAIASALQDLTSGLTMPWPSPPPSVNSVAERGGGALTPPDDQDAALLSRLAAKVEAEGPSALYALEWRVWRELDALWSLGAKVSPRPLPIPHAIRSLRPGAASSLFGEAATTEPVAEGESLQGAWLLQALSACTAEGGDATLSGGETSDEEGGEGELDGMALLRLQRLSYMLVLLVPEVSEAEGRQAVLEMPSIAARMLMLIGSLRRQRRVLAAVAALKGLDDEPPQSIL